MSETSGDRPSSSVYGAEEPFEPFFPDPEDDGGNIYDEESPFDPDEPDDYDAEAIYDDEGQHDWHDQAPNDLHDAAIDFSNDPDDNPYGIVFDQRGKRVPSTTHEILSDAAYEIGGTMSWQLLGIKGGMDLDIYRVDALSKGAVPHIDVEDFGDIADCVTINHEPTEELKKIYALTFNGNRAQLDDFIIYLRDKFAFPVGEDENPLDHLRVPIPLLMLASVMGRKQADS